MLKIVAALILLAALALGLYLYWRYVFFPRDPERKIPEGKSIVSPADGGAIFGRTVGGGIVYVKEFHNGRIPNPVKQGNVVDISEVTKVWGNWFQNGLLIGTFMSPGDVHTQRAPIAGTIETIHYWQNNNALLAPMWWQLFIDRLRGRQPDYFPRYRHILENERLVFVIKGRNFPDYVIVILIADKTVNQLTALVKEGDSVEKGQRIGKIGFKGSQVDIIIPDLPGLEVLVRPGDTVKAGETVLASY